MITLSTRSNRKKRVATVPKTRSGYRIGLFPQMNPNTCFSFVFIACFIDTFESRVLTFPVQAKIQDFSKNFQLKIPFQRGYIFSNLQAKLPSILWIWGSVRTIPLSSTTLRSTKGELSTSVKSSLCFKNFSITCSFSSGVMVQVL